jgi:hypothetical protein
LSFASGATICRALKDLLARYVSTDPVEKVELDLEIQDMGDEEFAAVLDTAAD